jgi:NitT/TauT family transport system ATP-binding protein
MLARTRGTAGAVTVQGVYFSHGRAAILAEVSCAIRAGEHVAIVGRSGAGKSTLLHLIAGLLRPARGRIAIDDAAVEGPARAAVLMFQRPALLPWASVRANILLPLRFSSALRRDQREALHRVNSLLGQIGLADRADALPAQLSGGQQQRVALARALASQPSILLLDEPFSALDPQTRAALRHDVRRLAGANATTLITVTHDFADAAALADRALLLAGTPARIVDEMPIGNDGERELRSWFSHARNAA